MTTRHTQLSILMIFTALFGIFTILFGTALSTPIPFILAFTATLAIDHILDPD